MRIEMSYLFRGRGQNPQQDKKQRAVTNLLSETTWNNDPLPLGIPPEDKVVVTISRQFGSGGAEVGHILEALRSSSPFNLHYNNLFKPTDLPTQAQEVAYLRLTQRVLLELATEGDVVIIGRGSQFLLHGAEIANHVQ